VSDDLHFAGHRPPPRQRVFPQVLESCLNGFAGPELARALAILEHAVGPTREAVPAFRPLDPAIDRVAVHERQLTLRTEQLGGGSVWTRRNLCEEPLHSFPHRQMLQKLDLEPTFRRFGGREWDEFEFARPRVCGQLQAAHGAPIHEANKGRGLSGGVGNRGAARGTLPRHGNPPLLSAVSSGINVCRNARGCTWERFKKPTVAEDRADGKTSAGER
jgi:hypothetical protein